MSDYQGFTNYTTFLVKVEIDNDEGLYLRWQEKARQAASSETAKTDLADQLKSELCEGGPELSALSPLDSSMLSAAQSEVNWLEIATDLLEEHTESKSA